jgi:hypothetical protein
MFNTERLTAMLYCKLLLLHVSKAAVLYCRLLKLSDVAVRMLQCTRLYCTLKQYYSSLSISCTRAAATLLTQA